jgi:hypothetical protein
LQVHQPVLLLPESYGDDGRHRMETAARVLVASCTGLPDVEGCDDRRGVLASFLAGDDGQRDDEADIAASVGPGTVGGVVAGDLIVDTVADGVAPLGRCCS